MQYTVLELASSCSVLVPFAAGIRVIHRLRREMIVLLVLFTIATLTECIIYYGYYRGIRFEWVHHLYTPLEYGLFATAFAMWEDNSLIRKIIGVSIPLFAVVCLLDAIFGRSLEVMNGLTISISCVLYVLLSSYSLLRLQRDELTPILKNPRFWICSALLFYSSGALVYFALLYYFPKDLLNTVWIINSGINITANFLYAGGFVCLFRR